MFCQKCGSKLAENEKFCSNCGNMVGNNGTNESNSLNNNVVKQNNVMENNQFIPNKKGKNKSPMIIIILVLLIVIAGTVIFLYNKNKEDKPDIIDKNDTNNNQNDKVEDNNLVDKNNIINKNVNHKKEIIEIYSYLQNGTREDNSIAIELDEDGKLTVYKTSCTENCNIKHADLNGEKIVKFVIKNYRQGCESSIYALTEKGDIYEIMPKSNNNCDYFENMTYEKLESEYKFTDIIPSTDDFNLMTIQLNKTPISDKSEMYSAITTNNKIFELNYGFIIEPSIPLEGFKFSSSVEGDYYGGNYALIYNDGKINYYDNIRNIDTYKNCIAGDSNNANKCFTKIFEMINYIYDENNQPIQAKVAFINTNNNKLYIVNQNDKMYSFSGEMNSGKYVATLLYQKKVTKIESTYETLEIGTKNFYTIDLTFDDGTKESYKNPTDFNYNGGAYDLTNK